MGVRLCVTVQNGGDGRREWGCSGGEPDAVVESRSGMNDGWLVRGTWPPGGDGRKGVLVVVVPDTFPFLTSPRCPADLVVWRSRGITTAKKEDGSRRVENVQCVGGDRRARQREDQARRAINS